MRFPLSRLRRQLSRRESVTSPAGPRACALPVAEEAQAQCAPRSARCKTALSGAAAAGHRKRRGVSEADGEGKLRTCKGVGVISRYPTESRPNTMEEFHLWAAGADA